MVTMTHRGFWSSVSTAGDFRELTPPVVMRALARAGTVVREPVHRFRLEVPAGTLAALARLLARLRPVPQRQAARGASETLEGEIPAASVHELQRRIGGLTRGEGLLEYAFARYQPVAGAIPTRPRARRPGQRPDPWTVMACAAEGGSVRGRHRKPPPCAARRGIGSVGSMRNIWKGLFVGALAGAAVGLMVDLLYGAGGQLAVATREAGRRVPDAADWATAVTAEARRRLREANLPDQVRSFAQAIADSDVGPKVVDATAGAAASGGRAVRNRFNNVRDAAR